MNDTERILAEIAHMREDVNARIDRVDSRLDLYQQALRVQFRRSRKQQASIAELERKVKELSETAAIWRSQDLREVGIDRGTAYEAFHELGYSNRDALKLLEKAGLLRRGGSHLTKNVRRGDRIIRAVVIISDID